MGAGRWAMGLMVRAARVLACALVVGTALTGFPGATGVAGAATSHPGEVIAIVGAGSTEGVMRTVLGVDPFLPNTDDANFSVAPRQATPLTVPADAACGSRTYVDPAGPGQVTPPAGSSSGRDALRDDPGCVDIARSDLGPRAVGATTGDLATFEYYAYGLDAVSWATPSLRAPSTLRRAELLDIYACVVTDWGQVGGVPGPIRRTLPPEGSGTREAFLAHVLDLPADHTFPSGADCPPVLEVTENDARVLSTPANAGDYEQFIVAYSMGRWAQQANNRANPTIDLRNGLRPGAFLQVSTLPQDFTGETVGVRFRSQNTGNEIYLGENDLGVGANRVEAGATWPAGTYPITFSSGVDEISTTGNGAVLSRAVTPCALPTGEQWNAVKIQLYARTNGATTALQDLTVNGDPIGDFGPVTNGGTESFVALIPAPLETGFSITGDLVVSGWTAGSESNKAEITVGCVGPPPEESIVPVRWDGAGYLLNDATVFDGRTATAVNVTAFDPTLTGPAGRFSAADVGRTVEGPGVTAGSRIVAVGPGGASATLDRLAAGTWAGVAVEIGDPVVGEANPNVLAPDNTAVLPGVLYLWNVVDSASPGYVTARGLVGFVDAAGGGRSGLCAGDFESTLFAGGFLPLVDALSPGGNLVTCRRYAPA